MPKGLCRNCDGYAYWGVFCWYCVRAWLTGLLSAIGAGLGAWATMRFLP